MFLKRIVLSGVAMSALLLLSGCGGSSAPISIAVTSSAATVDGSDTATLSAAVTDDRNSAGVTWTVSGGGTLSNTTTTSATYTAPAASSSALTVTVTATSVADTTKTGTTTITVPAQLAVTTTSSNLAGKVGTTYSVQLAGSGGISPYTWTVASGSTLPAGLSLSTAGVISGTPLAAGAGTTNVGFVMKDSGTATALSLTQTLGVTITAASAITFTGTVPATGTYNLAFTGSAAASGGAGTLTYSLASGALPTGLSLNATSGAITGTPTAVGTFPFTIKASDAFGDSANQGYSVTIGVATPTLTFAAIPTHTYGDAPFTVSATSASSGAVTYSVTSGTATIAGSTVTITGVGTVVLGASQAANGNYGTATASTSFTVNPETPTLTFAAIPTHTLGDAPFTVSATSASTGAVTYSITSGPATIVGNTVTLTGSGTVVLGASQAANGNYGTATASTSFTVNAALSITTSTTLPSGTVSTLYTQTLAATGGSGTYSNWTVTAGGTQLAALNLSLSTGGLLSGTPTTNGSAIFTAQVTDSQSHTASATFTVTIYTGLTVTTTSLPATNVGTSYSQQLAAAGGTGTGYSWTATSSNLSAHGLSLSTGGLITGTVTQTGTAGFTANVKDSNNNTALQALTITVYSALSLPAPDPSSLPSTGNTNVAYTGAISASGGSGNYSWQVTGLSDNLSSSITGGTLTISGTPGATPATVSFNVTLTDTTTNASVTQNGYSIAISTPTAVSLPTPSSSIPGPATENQSYNGAITVTGGVSPYTWSINGVTVTGGGLALSNGLTASSSGGASLTITGTPTTLTTVSLTNVKVTDSIGSNQTNSYSIAVNSAGSSVSGQISLPNICGSSTLPIFTVGLYNGSTLVTSTTTDPSTGNYSFSGVANGTYTITPSIAGATSSLFSPTSYPSVTLNNSTNSNVTGENFSAAVGYTVSGTVSYGGSQRGQTYLFLNNNNCPGNYNLGTSISQSTLSSSGSFSVRGVPPGAYTLVAEMDPLDDGTENAIDPVGNYAPVTVTNANVSNAAVTMTDPTFVAPKSNPGLDAVIPTATGVLISFTPSTNNNDEEDASQYIVEWSTSATLGGGSGGQQFLNIAGSHTFAASGTGSNVWILNNTVTGTSSFTAGTTYYFQARSVNNANSLGLNTSGWCNYTSSGCSGTTGFTGVVIGTPTCTGTCTTVSGAVTIPSGVTITPGAPLYAGVFQISSNGKGPSAIYATEIASPVAGGGGNSYSLAIPSGAGYVVFGIYDQNNNGLIDAGDVTNVRNNNSSGMTISGSTMTENLTLPSTNSSVQIATQYDSNTYSGGSSTNYQLNLQVYEANKLPVAVTLTSGPNLMEPVDIRPCFDCGNQQFDYSVQLPGGTPSVGDSYDFTVTYSDGSQDTGSTVNGQVTAFGSTGAVVGASELATSLSPAGTSSTSTTPTFTWTFPANPSNYVYSFYISPSTCTGTCGNIWQIPGNNSNSSGFTYAETGSGTTGTLTWGTDPITGDSSLPTGPLSPGTVYNWTIQVQDTNGNQAQTTTWYQP